MTSQTLPWLVAAVSLLATLVAVVASLRAQAQLRVAHHESIASKNEQIASLEAQLASLRDSESIRFIDRYVAAKKGLEERVNNLQQKLDAAHEEQEKVQADISDLGLSDRERETEVDRLQRDLHRTTDQIRRLELVLREVANVGPMDVQVLRVELDGRRELAGHIRERLDRLTFQEQDRLAARRSLANKLERLNEETARIRRDIEITRAAGSILDGILGIDADVRKRLARHASTQIDEALETLGDASRRSPISRFAEILEKPRPERLLESGEAGKEPVAAEVAPQVSEPPASPTPDAGSEGAPADRDRARGPYWTPVS